jgi:alpha-tubulin suppressor-like RCC1 family protein
MEINAIKTVKFFLLVLFLCGTSACFRSAPPLEEDEIATEAVTDPVTQDTPKTEATPVPTVSTSSPTPRSTPVVQVVAPVQTVLRPNNVPLIMQIGDQTADEYSSIGPISLRIFDFDDPVQCEDIIPASNNQSAVAVSPPVNAGEAKVWGDITLTGGKSTECGLSIKTMYAQANPVSISLTLKDPSDQTKQSTSTFNLGVNSTNTAPFVTSSGSSYLTMPEDGLPQSILLSRFDDSTKRENRPMTLSRVLEPALGLIVYPSGFPNSAVDEYVIYSPTTNLNGLDSFSYKICDDDPGIKKCSDLQTVFVNVTPVNDPPRMNAVADQDTSESVSKFVEFTLEDDDGPLQCNASNFSYETMNYAGDNPNLIEAAGAVQWGGVWPVCSGTITPKTGERGVANIKFSFNDGNPFATASRVFKLTVHGVNKAPEILSSISPQTINEDSSVVVDFVVRDLDMDASNAADYVCSGTRLSYLSGNTSLLASSARVVWSGNPAWPNCRGTVTPNANANGNVNVTFIVTDPGGLTASKTFQLTVNAVNDTPTGTVYCDGNSTTDIVKAGRTGLWSLSSCTGATDYDNETLTYKLFKDAGSPFNHSAGFFCPAIIANPMSAQAFSTTEYGTCKYKIKACDAANECTPESNRFVEITSYKLDVTLAQTKPSLDQSCAVSTAVSYSASGNILNFNHTVTPVKGTGGIGGINANRTASVQPYVIPMSTAISNTFLISTAVNSQDTVSFTSLFSVYNGVFQNGSQGGSAAANLISASVESSAYTITRALESLTVKSAGQYTTTGVAVDGLQTEYATTGSVCRMCNSTVSYASITAGALHSCLVDGSVSKCWGKSDGRLGLADSYSSNNYLYPLTTSVRNSPHDSAGFVPLQMSAGKDFTCALGTATAGAVQVRCAGSSVAGSYGQLGIASQQRVFNTPVNFPAGVSPVGLSVSKSGYHGCAIATDGGVQGKLFCWGKNDFGQLGNGSTVSAAGTVYPVSAGELFADNSSLFSVSAGKTHTCAVQYKSSDSSSDAYCWGRNNSGQLGIGSTVDSQVPAGVSIIENIVQIAAGDGHTCALTDTKEIYCWGDNSVGQLGIGNINSSAVPVKISSGLSFVQISAGSNHNCALTHDSKVYCWGLGTSGQLGVGKVTTTDQEAGEDCNTGTGVANITFCKQSPSVIEPAPAKTPVTVSAGDLHTCMMTIEGNVYCWGANSEGQLGTSNRAQVSSPTAVCNSSSSCSATLQLTSPRPRMCSRYFIP